MKNAIFRRDEFLTASLDLGTVSLELSGYATTGLRALAIGPSGIGKTNIGLVLTEQLSHQGWICVAMDPEGELAQLLGEPMRDASHLESHLRGRHHPILTVPVRDTADFLHYGKVIMRVVDEERKPVFLMVDEGQIFSTSRRSKGLAGEASTLMNDFSERGRKRALDLFITAHRFSGTLARSVFHNKNLTFVGRQEDPTAWSALAPQFKGSEVTYGDLAALAPGEFYCFSRRGVEKAALPMASCLQGVALKIGAVKPIVPATFAQWDRAMRDIPADRLKQLTPDACGLLGAIAGLTSVQLGAGCRALQDELEARG